MWKLMEKRLVDWALRLWQNDETVIDEISKFAHVSKKKGYYVISGPGRSTVGLMAGLDPITIASVLAFAFIGPLWPKVVPGLLPTVDKQYKAWIKRAKTRKLEQEEEEEEEGDEG